MYKPMGNVVIKYFTSCKILLGPIKVGSFNVKYGNYFEVVSCSGFCILHWTAVKQSIGSLATPPNPRLVPTSQVFPHHCRQPLPHAEMGDVSRSVKYRSSPPDPWQLNTSGGSYKKRPSPSKQNMREPSLASSDVWHGFRLPYHWCHQVVFLITEGASMVFKCNLENPRQSDP